jgi:hypothetical protein
VARKNDASRNVLLLFTRDSASDICSFPCHAGPPSENRIYLLLFYYRFFFFNFFFSVPKLFRVWIWFFRPFFFFFSLRVQTNNSDSRTMRVRAYYYYRAPLLKSVAHIICVCVAHVLCAYNNVVSSSHSGWEFGCPTVLFFFFFSPENVFVKYCRTDGQRDIMGTFLRPAHVAHGRSGYTQQPHTNNPIVIHHFWLAHIARIVSQWRGSSPYK